MKYMLAAVALLALLAVSGAVKNGKHDDGHPHTGQKDGHHKYRRSPSPQGPPAGPLSGALLNSPLLQPLQGLLAPLRTALAALSPPARAPAAAAPAPAAAAQG